MEKHRDILGQAVLFNGRVFSTIQRPSDHHSWSKVNNDDITAGWYSFQAIDNLLLIQILEDNACCYTVGSNSTHSTDISGLFCRSTQWFVTCWYPNLTCLARQFFFIWDYGKLENLVCNLGSASVQPVLLDSLHIWVYSSNKNWRLCLTGEDRRCCTKISVSALKLC